MGGKEKSSFKKIVTSSIKLLFSVVFILVLFLAIQMGKQPEQPPHLFGYQGLTVLSNSMNPAFKTGDLVIAKSTDASKIQKDDVITFKTDDAPYVTHRVVETANEAGETSFITKGDNNNTNDEEVVSANHLAGKVLFHIPYFGYLAKFIGSKTGLLLFIVLPVVGYLSLVIYEWLGRNERKENVSS